MWRETEWTMARRAGAILGMLVLAHAAAAQFAQQGSKLVGTGAVGAAHQGNSVAISADGNTAIVGGYADNAFAGAAWVFTRSEGVWSQQGSKLVGTGAVGIARSGQVGGDLGGRQHRHRRRARRQLRCRRRVGVHAQRRACGRSRGASWSARAPSGMPSRARRWRSRRTATPPSSVGRRQLLRRRRVGVHAQRGRVVAAGQQAGRHGRRRGCQAGLLGGDLGGRQHRHRRRARRQLRRRRRVGVHAQRRGVVAAGEQAGRHGRRRTRIRATRWRSRRTATRPSSAGSATTPRPAPRGSSRAAGGCGRSRAASWSARAPSGLPRRVPRWRSRRTATPPSSAATATTSTPAPRGCSRAAGGCGRSRAASWSARAPSGLPTRALGGDLGGRHHRHRRRALRQLQGRRRVGLRRQRLHSPSITAQPQDLTIQSGQTATLW